MRLSRRLLKLAQSSLIYSLSGLAGRFLGVFLVPLYTRVFSPIEYGVVDLIATVTTLISLFVDLGLNSAMGRHYVGTESPEDRRTYASTGLALLLCFSGLVTFGAIAFSSVLAEIVLQGAASPSLISLSLISIPASVAFRGFQMLLRFNFRPLAHASLSIGSLLLQSGLTVYMVLFLRMGIPGIYIARIVTMVALSLVGFWLTRSCFSWTFSMAKAKELLRFGVPLVPLALAHYVMTFSDRYFLSIYKGLDEVGLYGIGYRLSSVIGLVVTGFQRAWGPFVYATYKKPDARATFERVFRYGCFLAIGAVTGLSIFSRELLMVFTTQEYLGAYKVVPFIATSTVVYTFGGYFSIGIGIAKRNVHRAWTGILAAVINLGLNFLLIPPLGMIGAAIATICSFVLLGIVLMRISQRLYRVEYRFARVFALAAVAAGLIWTGMVVVRPGLNAAGIGAKVGLLGVYLGAAWLLDFFGLDEVRSVWGALRHRRTASPRNNE